MVRHRVLVKEKSEASRLSSNRNLPLTRCISSSGTSRICRSSTFAISSYIISRTDAQPCSIRPHAASTRPLTSTTLPFRHAIYLADKYSLLPIANRSITSKYILNPYWNALVKLFPKTIAPNTVRPVLTSILSSGIARTGKRLAHYPLFWTCSIRSPSWDYA